MKSRSDLRQRAESLAKLQEAVEEARLDLKAACDSAKSAGYSASALRKAIKVHTMTAEKRAAYEDEQTQLELYLGEIEGKASHLREVA